MNMHVGFAVWETMALCLLQKHLSSGNSVFSPVATVFVLLKHSRLVSLRSFFDNEQVFSELVRVYSILIFLPALRSCVLFLLRTLWRNRHMYSETFFNCFFLR